MLPIFLLLATQIPSAVHTAPDPFARLTIYNGAWRVKAEHPWSGGEPGAIDRLVSRCERFTLYFACEQTVNGKTQALIVYTVAEAGGKLHSRFISPEGLAGARGDLTLDANHWIYLDKPPLAMKGKWSRVENFIVDHDHIRFEEYESADEGKSWTEINFGVEERMTS